jgi:hypothetical protein
MELPDALVVIGERLPVGWSFRVMDDSTCGDVTRGRIWRWVILDIQGYAKVFRPNSVSPEEFKYVEDAVLSLAAFLLSSESEWLPPLPL